jgi:hypothetical protein
MLLHLGRRDEARHPELLEPGDLAVQGALRRPGLSGTLGWGVAEEDNRADELVGALPIGVDAALKLAPLVGRRDPLASCRHLPSPPLPRCPACPTRTPARDRSGGRAMIRACQGHEQYVYGKS